MTQRVIIMANKHHIVKPLLKETPNKGQDSEHQNVTFL